jgi:hypothetical protein
MKTIFSGLLQESSCHLCIGAMLIFTGLPVSAGVPPQELAEPFF